MLLPSSAGTLVLGRMVVAMSFRGVVEHDFGVVCGRVLYMIGVGVVGSVCAAVRS